MSHVVSVGIPPAKLKESLTVLKKNIQTLQDLKEQAVLRVATISLWGSLLVMEI